MSESDRFYFQTAMANRLERLRDVDLASRAKTLGVHGSGKAVVVPFFGVFHHVSADGVTDYRGHGATPAVAGLLLEYVLQKPAAVATADEWITFREFPGAGPLMGFFVTNTNKLIETHFAGDGRALVAACSGLTGNALEGVSGIDHCVELTVLPRMPMRIAFNARDDDFPAQCTLLFQQSAGTYLSMQSVAVAGTWLAGRLVASNF